MLEMRVRSLVQEYPPEMEMQLTLVFLPRKSMDRGGLQGYSLWGRRGKHNLVTEQPQPKHSFSGRGMPV